jgi:hypothetical protein
MNPLTRDAGCTTDPAHPLALYVESGCRERVRERVAAQRNGWHSAGNLAQFEDAEVQPWERLVEDPDQLERAQPQRERRAREREER